MSYTNLEKTLKELTQLHTQTLSAFEAAELDTATRSEYKRQIDQYESMYQSLEQMKNLSKDEKTISSLLEKQSDLLQQRIAFEKYCFGLWEKNK
ncbi:MAG: hypothetical protein U0K68_07270 [Agathobacter sp.]|nr:hypothetical protein [Agathobacter sp.]